MRDPGAFAAIPGATGVMPGAMPEEEERSPGQKALGVMKSLVGVLGGAAYAAGVSGAAQNPWAGPHALAQLRQQGVEMRGVT